MAFLPVAQGQDVMQGKSGDSTAVRMAEIEVARKSSITDTLDHDSRNLPDSSSAAAEKPVKTRKVRKDPAQRFYWNDAKRPLDSMAGTKKAQRHSPLYATLFSAALPGLGQAYNKKYWKIPIVYAGFAGLGYAIYYTSSNFIGYRNAYRLQVDDDPNTYGTYEGVDDASSLQEGRDYFKRNLDVAAICTGVWYALNLVDAAVDAHLFDWNMKEDLALSWRPTVLTAQQMNARATLGIRLQLDF